MKKKVLGFLLTCVMLVSCMSVTAMAVTADHDSAAGYIDGQSYEFSSTVNAEGRSDLGVVGHVDAAQETAAEIEAGDWGIGSANNFMPDDGIPIFDDLDTSQQNTDILEKLDAVRNDPDSTMLDFIRATNPDFLSTLTEADCTQLAGMYYQDALNGAYAPNGARMGAWYGTSGAGLRFGRAPILYYSAFFISQSTGDWPYGNKCKLVTVTSTIIDMETNKTLAYQEEVDQDTDYIYISEDSVTGIQSNRKYKNYVLAFGTDPEGVWFSIPNSDQKTSPDYN